MATRTKKPAPTVTDEVREAIVGAIDELSVHINPSKKDLTLADLREQAADSQDDAYLQGEIDKWESGHYRDNEISFFVEDDNERLQKVVVAIAVSPA